MGATAPEPIRVTGTVTDAGGTRYDVEFVVDDPRLIALISPPERYSIAGRAETAEQYERRHGYGSQFDTHFHPIGETYS